VHLEHNADAGLRLRQLLRAEFLFHFDPAISPPSAGRQSRAKSFTHKHICATARTLVYSAGHMLVQAGQLD